MSGCGSRLISCIPWPGENLEIASFRMSSRQTVEEIEQFIEASQETLSSGQLKKLDRAVVLMKTANKILQKAARKGLKKPDVYREKYKAELLESYP